MRKPEEMIEETGVIPVIKLNHPERDAVPLAQALLKGGVPVAESPVHQEVLHVKSHNIRRTDGSPSAI